MTRLLHSYWAYIVLFTLIFAIINALKGFRSKRNFESKDLRISLFAMITTHIQLVIGFISYYLSNYYATMRAVGMGEVMKSSELRKPLVEHPIIIIIAVVLITIGFVKHKKKTSDIAKFRTISIYYILGLILILSRIPWELWFTN